ncbi:MAG TPA: [Fe-Fe] hydrogenase large subunit C-terminal domain-containing protein [Bacillota bacterium]|nr:[Fe-Fe] hydrogenase large subunit C-terminal domain-containing protein [Bacillota bacterium]
MTGYFHSVRLDEAKCRGCTNCIKTCPTEAIRVRDGIAVIDSNRCIDCGQCIKICPNRAKSAFTDERRAMDQFKYRVALPAPSFFAQFRSDIAPGRVIAAVRHAGFTHVYEVGYAARAVARAIAGYVESSDGPFPLISTSCPVVVRLIQVRFPDLLKNVVPIEAPMEVAAYLARAEVMTETGCSDDDIGVFFLTPCPAKVTAVHQPVGQNKSRVNGAFSISDIYPEIFHLLEKVEQVDPVRSGPIGLNWARAGGESEDVNLDEYLAIDGLDNIISLFEEVELGRLRNLKFIEAQSCPGGCVGGILTVENPFIAKVRLGRLAKTLPDIEFDMSSLPAEELRIRQDLSPRPILSLDDDFAEAVRKMSEIDRLMELLPMLDCGACGAPTCRALAEDIVRGKAELKDCLFALRQQLREHEAGAVIDKDKTIFEEEKQ